MQTYYTKVKKLLWQLSNKTIDLHCSTLIYLNQFLGETTVSNEVLDTVLKAGEVLKIRGLWRQSDESGGEIPAEKATTTKAVATNNTSNKTKKTDEVPIQPKIAIKKDDKLLKAFNPVQGGPRYLQTYFWKILYLYLPRSQKSLFKNKFCLVIVHCSQ